MNYKSILLGVFAIAASTSGMRAADPSLSFSGSGTEADPWKITSKADVMELARACNGDGTLAAKDCGKYSGKYFILTADIDMQSDPEFIGIATAPEGQVPSTQWKFQGNFDGQGHTIRNMSIKGTKFDATGKALSTGKTNSRKYCGFFGIVEGGTVSNLNIDASCYMDAYGCVGAIAGQIGAGTRIENCTSGATIVSYDQYGGGIVGYSNTTSAKRNSILDCANYGNVRVLYKYGGGIAGEARYTDITGCANVGALEMNGFNSVRNNGVQQYGGGITGSCNYSNIYDCINAGSVGVEGTYVGGIAGIIGTTSATNGTITGCVSTGALITPDAQTSGTIAGFAKTLAASTVSGCWYDRQLWGETGVGHSPAEGASGALTSRMTDGNVLDGLDAGKWLFEKGFYPRLKSYANEYTKRAAATYVVFAEGQQADEFTGSATVSTAMSGITAVMAVGKYFSVSDGKVIVGSTQMMVSDTIRLENGSYRMEIPVVKPPKAFEGKGTEAEPYLISSKEDLVNLAALSNGAVPNHFEDTWFRLTSDIDMAGIEGFLGISARNNGKYQGTPIWWFSGKFDGNGHKISNMHIRGVVFDANGAVVSYGTVGGSVMNVGFFGSLGAGAVVENLTIDETCSVEGYMNVGSIAGLMTARSTVRNCVNGARITGYQYHIGGIAGYAYSSKITDGIVISDCINYGDVLSNDESAGGIVGDSRAMISGCLNAGNITVRHFNDCVNPKTAVVKRAGGIAGSNVANITACVNIGNVYCDSIYAGGLTGFNSNGMSGGLITGCLNAGQVSAKDMTTAGAFIGEDYHKVGSQDQILFSSCFYDSQYSGTPGAQGIDTKGIEPLRTDSLTGGNAIESLAETFVFAKGFYPLPKNIAAKEIARRIASTFITMPGNQTLGNFIAAAGINSAMPLVAEVAEPFYIDEGMVKTHPVNEIRKAELSLTNGAYTRLLSLTTLPSIFTGDGTEENPYLISSVEDFLKIGPFMTESGFDFEDRVFRLTADIDFAVADTCISIGSGQLYFNGTFDGNEKTIANFKTPKADDTTDIGGAGIFGGVGEKGRILNLKVKGAEIRGNTCAGSIAGYLYGKVVGCSTDETSKVTVVPGRSLGILGGKKGDYAGGIAGYMAATASVSDCENKATVQANKQAGGIAGGSSTDSGALIERCTNYGTVGAVAPQETELVGGQPSQVYVDAMAGGIAGRLTGVVRHCENHGHILATKCNTAGGILGHSYIRSQVDSCRNYGLIEVAWEYAGGIVGNLGIASTGKRGTEINACENHGTVKAMSGGGGIAGQGNNGCVITSCANFGNISLSVRGGGIVGRSVSGVTVSDSYNAGTIKANGNSAGIVGDVTTGGLKIERCFNIGNVTTESLNGIAGGILNVASGPVIVNDCYNAGDITGQKYVGGIAGKVDQLTIARCYNAGTVTCTKENNIEKYAGNIVGMEGAVISNCYRLSNMPAFKIDGNNGEVIDPKDIFNSKYQLGDAFVYDANCLPRLKATAETDAAKAFSAYYLLDPSDSETSVGSPMKLGQPGDVEWKAEGFITIDGDEGRPTGNGKGTLTAVCGDFTRNFTFDCIDRSGVDELAAEGLSDVRWFNLDGTDNPSPRTGDVVIMTGVDIRGKRIARKVRF